jgi:hypothetical protein
VTITFHEPIKAMSKQIAIKLDYSDISHILALIQNNEDEGWYYGVKDHYWKRSERIKSKLKIAQHLSVQGTGKT